MRVSATRRIVILCVVVCAFPTDARLGAGQQSPTTQQLVAQLGSPDRETMGAAGEALLKQRAAAVPALVDGLDKHKTCQSQVLISGLLRMIEPAHPRVEPAFAAVVRGECTGDSERDVIFKQESAFLLSYSASGLALLGEMASHADVGTRRRVAFAFDELTERITATSMKLVLPPDGLDALAKVLPKLKPLLSDADEVVRCMTLEALEQASESTNARVSAAAKSLLPDKAMKCGGQD